MKQQPLPPAFTILIAGSREKVLNLCKSFLDAAMVLDSGAAKPTVAIKGALKKSKTGRLLIVLSDGPEAEQIIISVLPAECLSLVSHIVTEVARGDGKLISFSIVAASSDRRLTTRAKKNFG